MSDAVYLVIFHTSFGSQDYKNQIFPTLEKAEKAAEKELEWYDSSRSARISKCPMGKDCQHLKTLYGKQKTENPWD